MEVELHDPAVRVCATKRCPLASRQFDQLKAELLSSPLVGQTTLNGPFQSSRGFAATFHGEGVAPLVERFPSLIPYLAQVQGRPAVRALTPFYQRTLEPFPNAWYLNLLLVGEGGSVPRHVDATLRGPSQVEAVVPQVVTVLYLDVPPCDGGALTLFHGNEPLGSITPRTGLLVHFRGDLSHQVEPFTGARPGALRASLVLEQYTLPPEGLAALPPFQLDSRAGFGAFLRLHAGRPARTFPLD